MNKQLINKYRPVLFPAAVVAIAIVLSLVVGKFLLDKVNFLRTQIADTEQKVNVLESRLNALNGVQQEIASSVNVASLALPDKNPTILVVSQIRKQAASLNVSLRNISVTAQQASGAESIQTATYEVSFFASGQYADVSDFIDSLSRVTPVVNLNTVYTKLLQNTLVQDNAAVESQVSLTAYSSPYPEDLPSLTEPISGLSDAEQQTLLTLEGFTSPSISSLDSITPSLPSGAKANPFSAAAQ